MFSASDSLPHIPFPSSHQMESSADKEISQLFLLQCAIVENCFEVHIQNPSRWMGEKDRL